MARFELNKTSTPFLVFTSEKITTDSVDNFFTCSLLVGCFAIRDQFYWQKQKTHNNVYWNISDLVAKSIIAVMALVAVIGFLILISRVMLFFIKPNRFERMKEKQRHLFENQERDSAFNTVLFFLMGGLMATFSLKYIGFSLATATGFGVALDHIYRVHIKTPQAETSSKR